MRGFTSEGAQYNDIAIRIAAKRRVEVSIEDETDVDHRA